MYEVTIYFGGERPAMSVIVSDFDTAKRLSFQGEHAEIIDLRTNEIIFFNERNGSFTNDEGTK